MNATLQSGVENALNSLSEQLESLEEDLQTGLHSLGQDLTGPLSKQWNMVAVVDYGSQIESTFEVSVSVAQLYQWYGSLEYAESFRPQQWQLLQEFMIYATPGAMVYSWTYGDNPEAVAARDAFNDHLPQFQATNDGAVRDVRDLIDLPRKLGSFYTQWETARDKMDAVPGRIDQALQLDKTAVTWSGAGHDAYRAVAETQKNVADAVRAGITGLLDDVVGFTELGVDVVETLHSAAQTLKSGLATAASDLLGVLADPRNWLGIVNTLINAYETGRKLQDEAAIAGVGNLTSIIQRQATIQNHFSELQRATASSSPEGISWPDPSTDMQFAWEPTMNS